MTRRTKADLLGVEESGPELLANIATLADVLGCAASTIRRLTTDGVLIKSSPGKYDLRVNVRRYISHRTATKPGASDKARREAAQADLVEAKAAALRGTLVEAAAVEREWSSILRDVRAGMLAVPGRVQARVPHLSAKDIAEIASEIRQALTSLGDDHAGD
ncbi:hypothetical protein [Hyphomonas sp. ND6WE1B]|uniref:hypothetical protein n=1 Tax=Hyphomonas sp. ND6WE1B TaxID=1848191 RepID=UPI0008075CA0|nr:hypothetical protein [Hyphomonas sp. ND6WE1B]